MAELQVGREKSVQAVWCMMQVHVRAHNPCRNSRSNSLPSHLNLFNFTHIGTMGIKVLQRARLKAFPSVWQVQPQPLCLGVIGPNDDHISPAGGAGITLQASADGDVVWYDCKGRAQHLIIHKSKRL